MEYSIHVYIYNKINVWVCMYICEFGMLPLEVTR